MRRGVKGAGSVPRQCSVSVPPQAAEEERVRKIAMKQQQIEEAKQKRIEEKEEQLEKKIDSALDKR